jgi:hypothetical protein
MIGRVCHWSVVACSSESVVCMYTIQYLAFACCNNSFVYGIYTSLLSVCAASTHETEVHLLHNFMSSFFKDATCSVHKVFKTVMLILRQLCY